MAELRQKSFQAQVLVCGVGQGPALILTEPLSLWGGLDPDTGEIIDRRHPASGQNVQGKVLVLPAGRGSSSASSILLEAVRQGTAPKAIITAESDAILALGATVAREMYAESPPVVVLRPSDYNQLKEGHWISVAEDGVVTLSFTNPFEQES